MVKMAKIESIKPYEGNAKLHPDKQILQIAKSIDAFGFNQPIVIDKDNIIIVGHGRYQAAKILKLKEIPILKVDLNEEQAKAYRLADNKLNESGWDMNLVIDELKGLSEEMIKLTGFDLKYNEKIAKTDIKINENFEVIVECENEDEQKIVYEELSKKYVCRLLTL